METKEPESGENIGRFPNFVGCCLVLSIEAEEVGR